MPNNVLRGTYFHNIDAKGRMSFPTKLREIIGDEFTITKGNDGCIFVYSKEEWKRFEDKIALVPMSKGGIELQRFFIAGSTDVETDKQGRIMIPQALREFAGLEKDVAVVGAMNRAEIWDKAKWDKFNADFTEFKLSEAMEALDF